MLCILLLVSLGARADEIRETEPNDNASTANATRGTGQLDIVGAMAPGSADSDYFSFEVADLGRFASPYDAMIWITIAGPGDPKALVCFDLFSPQKSNVAGGCAPNGTAIGLYPAVQGGTGVYLIAVGPWQSAGPYRISLLARADNGAVAPLLRGTEPLAVPLYRFNTGHSYFYTDSEVEKTYVQQAFPSWRFDGVAYHVHAAQVSRTLPVYRFNTGSDHFYTMDDAERAYIATHVPSWAPEGIAFFAYSSAEPGSLPVYRFNAGDFHFYTISEGEKDAVVRQMPGWRFEGVAYYALP